MHSMPSRNSFEWGTGGIQPRKKGEARHSYERGRGYQKITAILQFKFPIYRKVFSGVMEMNSSTPLITRRGVSKRSK